VLLPCYNEEATIGKVIDDFRRALPDADIFVYDNNSSDATSAVAVAHGAVVRLEPNQGKGHVVRSMFIDIDADYYLMADGDDTYPAEFASELLAPLIEGNANMVIGDRLSNGTYARENKRLLHGTGNALVRGLINSLYRSSITDVMTGYRAFDRFFVKTMPVLSSGFEIETELTIHALENRFALQEIPITYRDRPEGSVSKLSTLSDGRKVVWTIFKMCKAYRPLLFFGVWAALFALAGLLVGAPPVLEYFQTRFITKLPSAVLATGLVLISGMMMMCGLILSTIVQKSKQSYLLELTKMRKPLRL
jgi:glycosyltransferase involved in cell wall biosynthesis